MKKIILSTLSILLLQLQIVFAENYSTPKENKISICMATDDNYAQHTGVAITSILKNANFDDNIRIFILHESLSDANQSKLKELQKIRNFELIFRKIDKNLLKGFKIRCKHLSMATWFRVFIDKMCPECTDKILYLDVDMVILKSLKELWDTDLKDNYAGVVTDFQLHKSNAIHRSQVLKIKDARIYFNAGMILFNMKKCLEDSIFDKFIEYAVKNADILRFEDQDTMNVIMEGKLLYLHPKYNVQNSNKRMLFYPEKYPIVKMDNENLKQALLDPTIIHFISKPWKFFSNHRFRNTYFYYLKLTPWKDRASTELSDSYYNISMFLKSIFHKCMDFIRGRKLPI